MFVFIMFILTGILFFCTMNLGVKNREKFEKKFKNSPKTLVTIESFYKEIDRTLNTENYGALVGYRYIVSFIDEEGIERLGASDTFLEKLLLKKGEQVMAHYLPVDKSHIGAFKNYDYEILFCDKGIYRLEEECDKKIRRHNFIWGIGFIAIAFIIWIVWL